MKKFLLIIFVLLIMCSCGKKQDIKNPNEIVMSGIKYIVEEDTEEYGLKFKIASNFERRDFGNCISYYSEKVNDEYNFIIRLFKYNSKHNYESIIKDLAGQKIDYEDVIVNEVEYKYALYKGNTDIDIFIKKVGKEYYVFTFLAKDDIKKLEDVFLKGIVYQE